jgi:hypothetical protein
MKTNKFFITNIMRITNLALSFIALAGIVACSNESTEPASSEATGDAWLSLNVTMPQTKASGPGTQTGTAAESNATTIKILGLDSDQNKLGIYTISSLTGSDAFKVSKKLKYIFVVVNPDDAVTTAMSQASTFSGFNSAITEDVSNITGDNNFLMTSSGESADDHGLTDVSGNIKDTKAEAETSANRASVYVDRAMSKVVLGTFSATDENVPNGAVAAIISYLPSCTNKSYYPYAERIDYTLSSDYSSQSPAVYRVDPNFTDLVVDETTYPDEFNWVLNADEQDGNLDWIPAGTHTYCHENTMQADAQKYGNTTKLIIKAKYAPKGVNLGDSWFRMGGKVYTLEQLQAIYASDTVAATTKAFMDAFYTSMDSLANVKGETWTSSNFGDMVLSELDSLPNAGWTAAKVKTADKEYLIQYFQNSNCWYAVNIMNDYRVASGELGRWGVVRNSYYTINISTINEAGTPYIPDGPDDPDEPDTPDTPDDNDGYLAVDITVNPWTTWTQDVDL